MRFRWLTVLCTIMLVLIIAACGTAGKDEATSEGQKTGSANTSTTETSQVKK